MLQRLLVVEVLDLFVRQQIDAEPTQHSQVQHQTPVKLVVCVEFFLVRSQFFPLFINVDLGSQRRQELFVELGQIAQIVLEIQVEQIFQVVGHKQHVDLIVELQSESHEKVLDGQRKSHVVPHERRGAKLAFRF